MTIETYGLPEEKYLEILREKATLICKALRVVEQVETSYNIKLDPTFFWKLFEESSYAADDACRVYQKQNNPEALAERSYDPIPYSSSAQVLETVQKLETLVQQLIDKG